MAELFAQLGTMQLGIFIYKNKIIRNNNLLKKPGENNTLFYRQNQ